MRRDLKLQFRNPARAPLARAQVLRVARRVLAAENLDGPLALAVHLVDDATIRDVNRAQRGVDAPTDVLSFPLLAQLQPNGAGFALPPGEPYHLGDVLISYERAVAQAAEYGHGVEREALYLLAHGILHLLGYDHVEEVDGRAMRAREEAALLPLGITR